MASISEFRTRQGLSQLELAKRAGLRPETICRIETGRNTPHRSTIRKLAVVLKVTDDVLNQAIIQAKKKQVAAPYQSWQFLEGLDRDLRNGLIGQLNCLWTHNSTGLEGNTISSGDTHLILTEGLTVSDKSLREHEEIHGHGSAIKLLSSWLLEKQPLTVEKCHELHKLVQTTMVYDYFAPVGKWKIEPNGTTAIRSTGDPLWHDYSRPEHIPELMKQWLIASSQKQAKAHTQQKAVRIYTELHLGFVAIHPYADGNGRMARLLANFNLLKAGLPPISVSTAARKEYLTLLGDYCTTHRPPTPSKKLIIHSQAFKRLEVFFKKQWQPTMEMVTSFHQKQKKRQR